MAFLLYCSFVRNEDENNTNVIDEKVSCGWISLM